MAGFGKKLFYGIVTLLIGIFAVFPLIAFAAVTSSLAILWLSGTILFKGGGVIRRAITHWWQGDDRNSPAAIAERNRTAAIAKREARSRSESFSQSSASSVTPRSQSNRSNRSGSNVSLVSLPQNAPLIDRDYEGVGGWLIPRDNNDRNSSAIMDNDYDIPAVTSTIRPDATPTTFRRRSFGASSSGINSPEILNTPSLPRYSTSTALPRPSGSPQSYFNNGAAGRSTTSINSRRTSRSRRNSRATRQDGSTDERP